MICPVVVKVVATSIVVSPVTHTALVAVNSASKNDIPSVVARGSSKRPVPAMIRAMKLLTIIQLGDILFDSECVITVDSFNNASIATIDIIK